VLGDAGLRFLSPLALLESVLDVTETKRANKQTNSAHCEMRRCPTWIYSCEELLDGVAVLRPW